MTTLEWIAVMVCITAVAMLVGYRMSSRDKREADPVPNAVHYGHSDVADHEYDDLPHS